MCHRQRNHLGTLLNRQAPRALAQNSGGCRPASGSASKGVGAAASVGSLSSPSERGKGSGEGAVSSRSRTPQLPGRPAQEALSRQKASDTSGKAGLPNSSPPPPKLPVLI